MISEEHTWDINAILARYQYLQLTIEQAEKIYQYEQMKDSHAHKHFFSPWEEWDFELTTFREILLPGQLTEFEKYQKRVVTQFKKGLVADDGLKKKNMGELQDMLDFYETSFLPTLTGHFTRLFRARLDGDQAKVDFLKAEYSRFLNDTRSELLANHFRLNRSFMPNTLNAALLRHKLTCVVPAYYRFKHTVDKPTKATAKYLKGKLLDLPDKTEELIVNKLNELSAFQERCLEKYYYNDPSFGSLWVAKSTREEDRENLLMALLLHDANKYGY